MPLHWTCLTSTVKLLEITKVRQETHTFEDRKEAILRTNKTVKIQRKNGDLMVARLIRVLFRLVIHAIFPGIGAIKSSLDRDEQSVH